MPNCQKRCLQSQNSPHINRRNSSCRNMQSTLPVSRLVLRSLSQRLRVSPHGHGHGPCPGPSRATGTLLSPSPVFLFQHRVHRPIFSDAHFQLPQHRELRHKTQLQASSSSPMVKARVTKAFADSGLKNIFKEDLITVLLLAENQQDMQFIMQVLSTACHPDTRVPPNIDVLLRLFFRNCQELRLPQESMELMADLNVKRVLQEQNDTDAMLSHLMTLYNAAMYQEVLNEVEKGWEKDKGQSNTLLLAAAAGHHIRSQSALDQLTRLLSAAPNLQKLPTHRSFVLIAHLALLLGDKSYANDILSMGIRTSSNAFNVKLALYLECSRLQEALDITLKSMELARMLKGKIRPIVSFDLMKLLIDRVRTEADPGSKKYEQLSKVCDLVDEYAVVTEQSVEEMIMKPVQTQFERRGRRKTRRHHRQGGKFDGASANNNEEGSKLSR